MADSNVINLDDLYQVEEIMHNIIEADPSLYERNSEAVALLAHVIKRAKDHQKQEYKAGYAKGFCRGVGISSLIFVSFAVSSYIWRRKENR